MPRVELLDSTLRDGAQGEGLSFSLADYKVRVIDGQRGTAAAVRVLIESADAKGGWTTVGVSTDIIEASWIALVDSIEYKLIKDIETRYKTYI